MHPCLCRFAVEATDPQTADRLSELRARSVELEMARDVVTAWSNDAVVPAATLWQRRFEAARLAATSELRSRNLAVRRTGGSDSPPLHPRHPRITLDP